MTYEIERLKQQYEAELDLAQEVIVNLRRDLAHAHKRIYSQNTVWNEAIDAALDEASYGSHDDIRGRLHTIKKVMI